MPEGGERTEQASPKKREDERKKGNIFMSKDINTLVSLIVSFYAFRAFIGGFFEQFKVNLQNQLYRASTMETIFTADVLDIAREMLVIIVTTALPAMIIIALASVASHLAQTRFLFSTETLKFKMERISLLKGFKRLFSLRSLVELFKSLIKICVLTYILYINISKSVQYLPSMIDWDIMQAAIFAGEEIMSLVVSVAISFGAVALLDYLYQRWEYEKGIRMTKQEVKDEYKQMEGNPEIKSARRQKQREYAQRRMMAQVADADVIVRNPTHYAVALKYQIDVDPAPMVLAKGADLLAQKIVAEGEKHKIATVENKALARGLYDSAEVYDYIPAEFFQPVAELLAWLYTTKDNAENQRTVQSLQNGPTEPARGQFV